MIGTRVVSLSLSGLILLAALVAAPVYAQEEPPSPTETSEEVEANDQETSNRRDEKAAERALRLEELKTQRAERLTENEARRVANRCKAAQNKLAALQRSDSAKISNFTDSYNRILGKVDTIISRLQTAGVDTTALEQVYTDAETEISNIVEEMNGYLTLLEDLSLLACEEDPELFQAALTAVRENRATIKGQLQAVKAFLQTNVRAALLEAKASLPGAGDDADEVDATQPEDTEEGEE